MTSNPQKIIGTEELLNIVLNSVFEGFILSDQENKVLYINQVTEKITGWTNNEINLLNLKNICELPLLSNMTNDTEIKSVPISVHQKNGEKLIIVGSIKKIFLYERTQLTLITLYPEKNPSGGLDKAHMEFISTVSHELRTPLTSIKGFADTLIRSQDKIPEETRKKYINIISDQASRLIRLVEDILSVSRLESNRYQIIIRTVNLFSIIKRVCDSFISKLTNYKLSLEIEENLPNIRADSDRLEQILTNLIDNAIKYSPKDSKIIISAKSLENDNHIKEKVKIEITNFGTEIKEADLKKIFTRFGRLDSPLTRQTEGTGLGLYITKSLVLALGGEINVKSHNGQTTFEVILPTDTSNTGIPLS